MFHFSSLNFPVPDGLTNMENRYAKKLSVNFEAEIISGDGTVHDGTIKNISQNGDGCSLISTINSHEAYVPTLKTFTLNFQTPEDKTLFLDCRIKWLTRVQNGAGNVVVLGLELIGNNKEFINFIEALCNEK